MSLPCYKQPSTHFQMCKFFHTQQLQQHNTRSGLLSEKCDSDTDTMIMAKLQ